MKNPYLIVLTQNAVSQFSLAQFTAGLSKCFILMLLMSAFSPAAKGQPAEGHSDQPKRQLVQMFVERFNYSCGNTPQGSADNTDILMRELGRQAFTIALADEMNVPVRDQTLNEFAFDPKGDVELKKLAVLVRSNAAGKLIVRLYQVDVPKLQLWTCWDNAEPLWEKTYESDKSAWHRYRKSSEAIESAIATDFVAALQKVGIQKQPKPKSADDSLDAEKIELELSEVDFVSSFAVARRVHHAMQNSIITEQHIGWLVRAYAQMSVMTHHQFSPSSEVFAARALLYARRLMRISDGDSDALWHLAYALALTGQFNQAEFKHANALAKDNSTTPPWAELLDPYIQWNFDSLQEIAESDSFSSDWANRLLFQQHDAYGYEDRMKSAALKVIGVSPTAYGVYIRATANYGLSNKRYFGRQAPAAFTEYFPLSVSLVEDLPPSVGEVAGEIDPTDLSFMGTIEDPHESDAFNGQPRLIADRLKEFTSKNDSNAPSNSNDVSMEANALSWSALATWIGDEQIVQAMFYLRAAASGTEHEVGDAVDGVLPFLQGHQYAPLIESFKYRSPKYRSEFMNVAKKLKFLDLCWKYTAPAIVLGSRHNGKAKNRNGTYIWGRVASNRSLSHTAPSYWDRAVEDRDRRNQGATPGTRRFAKMVRQNAPHCELGTRLTVRASENPTPEQLAGWESAITYDAKAMTAIGNRYRELERPDDALRCLKKAMKMMPETDTAFPLADAYFAVGEYEQWEEVLRDLKENPLPGLGRTRVESKLAKGFLARGLWEEALPPATAAGQSYSAWGMILASRVEEALADWETSETWIRKTSQSYPTTSGHQWYFWCKRTGRGNLKQAESLAKEYFKNASQKGAPRVHRAVMHILNKDFVPAIKMFYGSNAELDRFERRMVIAQLCRRSGRKMEREQVLEKARLHFSKLARPSDEDRLGLALTEILSVEGKNPIGEDALANADKIALSMNDDYNAAAMAYVLGEELFQRGQNELAKKYFIRCLQSVTLSPAYSTLAGARLCELEDSHTSRPDDKAFVDGQRWMLRKQNKKTR